MNKSLFVLPVAALLLAGCETQSAYVEPNSSKLVVTQEINIQDFAQAGDTMVQSLIDNLIADGKLVSSIPGEKPIMAISRIANKTSQQFDTDMLIKKIRVTLMRTGKLDTTTTMNLGPAEDPLARDAQAKTEFFEDKKQTRMPDYTLSGKIIENYVRAGSTRQSSYVFQLSLSSTKGIAVWEEEKTITKQGNRPKVGF